MKIEEEIKGLKQKINIQNLKIDDLSARYRLLKDLIDKKGEGMIKRKKKRRVNYINRADMDDRMKNIMMPD